MRRVSDEELEVLAREALMTLPIEARRHGAVDVHRLLHDQGIIAGQDRVQLAVNAIQAQESEDQEEEDREPEHGDRVLCAYCGTEFTYNDPSAQQVGAGILWCGCAPVDGSQKEE